MLHALSTVARLPLLLAAVASLVGGQRAALALQSTDTIQWERTAVVEAKSDAGATLDFETSSGAYLALTSATPERDAWTVEVVTDVNPVTGVRIEFLADPAFPGKGPGMSDSGNFVLNEVELSERKVRGRRAEPLPLRYCSSSFSQKGHSITRAMDGRSGTGWAIAPRMGEDHVAIFELAEPLRNRDGTDLVLDLEFAFGHRHVPGRIRVSATSSPDPARSVRSSQVSPELQQKIDSAITRGTDWLLSRQQIDGSWAGHRGNYPTGQTALSVFALLKSGVRPEHPGVRRGLEFLRAHPPSKTYSAGCQLLAFCTAGREEDDERIEELAELVISWKRQGGYAYPEGAVDISCSQFGALGLRAAAQAGVDVPLSIWEELAEDSLIYQEDPATRQPGQPAGFAYRPGEAVSGSRTTAGITMLAAADEFLGPERLFDKRWEEARDRGLAWLGRNFSASRNPDANGGGGSQWLLYYLYGLERVGSMLQTTTIGGVDWYRAGADYLVDSQKDDGAWRVTDGESDTAFGLLFLTKASGPTTGASSSSRRTYFAAAPAGGLELRAAGDTPISIWVSGRGEGLEKYAWPADEEHDEAGLRVVGVRYVGPEQSLLDDARGLPSPWRMRPRDPGGAWAEPGYDDGKWDQVPGAFGLFGTPGLSVRSEWDTEELYLRQEFTYDPRAWYSPRLEVNFTSAAPTSSGGHSGPLVCLFDDDARFAARLHAGRGGVKVETADVWSGERCLRVSGQNKENPRIDGWGFQIKKKPEEGQFRYLHFAWKKLGDGDGIMVQVAREGQWKQRYYGGKNQLGWAADSVSRREPRRWETVTVDLWEDFGGDAILTGFSLVPMGGGDGLFDAIYLGRSKSDVRGLDPLDATAIEASTAKENPDYRIYLNGEEIHAGFGKTDGYEKALELEDLLVPGKNVIAAKVTRLDHKGQAFDLGVHGRRVLGFAEADPERHWSSERFAVRSTFRTPGAHKIFAEATVLDQESRPVLVRSEEMEVKITGSLDPELLRYASDGVRNRMRDDRSQVRVSSTHSDTYPAGAMTDGLLSGGWLCNEMDLEPEVVIEFDRGVKASKVLITPTMWPGRARPFKVWLDVNGRGQEVELRPEPDRKTEFRLKRPVTVRKLELRILERRDASPGRRAVGFAEIELQDD